MQHLVFIFFLLFSLLTSCQPKPKVDPKQNEKKISINLVSDPRTLDPRKSRDVNERILMNMFYEGLMREGKEGKNEPALAETIDKSDDGLRYTFHLKKAHWSNGDPITASDFVYAWKTSLDPLFPSENAYQLFSIKNGEKIKKGETPSSELGAVALDEATLQIDLENPIPYFLDQLSFSIFFPVHAAMDVKGWDLSKESLISSGPFSLKQWKHHDFIQAVKNPSYWDADTVHLSEINLVMVTEDTEIKMFEKKQLDWAGSPLSAMPTDLIDSFKKQKTLCSHPMLGTAFFRVNTERFPFNNVNIRKAFALAINRQEIVEHIIQGKNEPALGFIPKLMSLQKEPYFPDHQEELARSYLDKGLSELGISKEELPKIVLLYASLGPNNKLVQAVQQDWQRVLGVFAELEANEKKAFFSRLGQQDYQLAIGSWMADFNDPINFLSVFKYKKASTNNTEWENPEYISLLDASDKVKGEERRDLLCKSERILMEEMPIIPIYHHTMLYLKKENLKNVAISPLGNLDFKWAYLEESPAL
jgi:oligopeptide transport system substrate-binding protein